MHYYKRNIGDYHKKAGRLSMLEHGAYTLLIDACYDRERFPSEDEAIDWCWARTADEISAVKFVLSRFFTLEGGIYVQARVQEEVARYQENCETNAIIAANREERRRSAAAGNTNDSLTSRSKKSTKRDRSVDESGKKSNEAPPNQEPRTINQEPLTKNQEPKDSAPQAADCVGEPSGAVEVQAVDIPTRIFDHWKHVMNHPKAKLDDKRRKKILAALKLHYTPDDLIQAINGCAKTPFNMGCDGRNTTVYDDIELILRDSSHIDRFMRNNTFPVLPAISAGTAGGKGKFSPADFHARNATQIITHEPVEQGVIEHE